MDQRWGLGQWAMVPRFDHVQPSGKHRPIDDGLRSGHNAAMTPTETLDLSGPCPAWTEVMMQLWCSDDAEIVQW